MRIFFFVLLSLLFVGCAHLEILPTSPERIIDLKTGRKISFQTFLGDIENARVVIIGENHNEKSHHDIQLKITRELNRKNSIAVGMEMFQKKSDRKLEKWSLGMMDEKEMKSLFAKEWSREYYPLYAGILRFVKDNKIPLIGLNIPRELARRVASKGLNSLSEEEQKGLPQLSCDLPEGYREYLKKAYGLRSHKKEGFENFCAAQVLWDSSMASHAVEFLKENPKHQLIILAGSAHAQRLGIPARIRVKRDVTMRIIIPQSKGQSQREITRTEADYLWIPAGNGSSSL